MLTDLRLALRHLRRTPLFSAMAAVSLALGIGATALLLAVGLLACYFPARRAAVTDPAQALRSE